MIELADEIGREHVQALKSYFGALASLKPGAEIVCVLYADGDEREYARLQELGTRIVNVDFEPVLIYIPSLVWDVLRAHGLMSSFPPIPIEPTVPLAESTTVIHGTFIGSVRGENFLKRKWLAWLLSRFSANVNRRVMLAAVVLWPVLVIAIEQLARTLIAAT